MGKVRHRKSEKIFFIIIGLLFAGLLICLIVNSYSDLKENGAVRGDEVNVRSGPGKSNSIQDKVHDGDRLIILDTVLQKGSDKYVYWYKVSYYSEKRGTTRTGYIHSDYVRVMAGEAREQEFEKELSEFPESYKPYLRKLHEQYPYWHFSAYNTGLEWDEVLANEQKQGHNLISIKADKEYIDETDLDENGNQEIRDGTNWVAASKDAVAYFLDPRNFINEDHIFMFEKLDYVKDGYDIENVKSILSGTFMSDTYTCPDTGEIKSYAETFMEAGKKYGVSPYHLASRVKTEQGKNGNKLGLGTVEGYENIFNFYDIGAYKKNGNSAQLNGAIYAAAEGDYSRPWTNQYLSIMGGTEYVSKAYISVGQDTVYYEKFNVVYQDKLYKHEYMTNIAAPRTEASIIKKSYSGYHLNSDLYFEIPVYENMPNLAAAEPGNIDSSNVLDDDY